MTATALRPYQQKALDTCDGVIAIAKNEMLVRGTYVTSVVSPKMRNAGTVCGGRKACLVGSMYLAHGGFRDIDGVFMSSGDRHESMRNKPGLRLAYEAINEAAYRRAQTMNAAAVESAASVWSECGAEPVEGWGEWFFESFLRHRTSFKETREEIIRVTRHAKRLIRSGAVR